MEMSCFVSITRSLKVAFSLRGRDVLHALNTWRVPLLGGSSKNIQREHRSRSNKAKELSRERSVHFSRFSQYKLERKRGERVILRAENATPQFTSRRWTASEIEETGSSMEIRGHDYTSSKQILTIFETLKRVFQ